jgi:hypothetical protein
MRLVLVVSKVALRVACEMAAAAHCRDAWTDPHSETLRGRFRRSDDGSNAAVPGQI